MKQAIGRYRVLLTIRATCFRTVMSACSLTKAQVFARQTSQTSHNFCSVSAQPLVQGETFRCP
eukprot:5157010-Amphidinium_carterae.2